MREEVELREGVCAIEALVERAAPNGEAVKLSLPMGGDIARLMSAELQGQRILAVYWALAPAAVPGVVHAYRISRAREASGRSRGR